MPSAEHFARIKTFALPLGETHPSIIEPLDVTADWQLLEVHRSAGVARDYAVYRRRPPFRCEGMRVDEPLLDGDRIPYYLQSWVCDAAGTPTVPLCWGQLHRARARVDREDEYLATAALAPHHFGLPLDGVPVWSPDPEEEGFGEAVGTHLEVAINPLIDGRIEGNMSPALEGHPEYRLWIDPESVRTASAAALHGLGTDQRGERWSLQEVARSLCEWLNPAVIKKIHNPIYPGEDPPDPGDERGTERLHEVEPLNIRLRRGVHLPEILDTLLRPHGLSWYIRLEPVEIEAEEGALAIPRIEFVDLTGRDRAWSPLRTLTRQAAGEQVDLDASRVSDSLEIQVDLGRTANHVVCHGSLVQREVTLELFRGWPAEEDGASDLRLDGPAPNAWRRWVANEGGDYTGLRAEIDAVPDLNAVFIDPDEPGPAEQSIHRPKRREIEEPLVWRDGSADRVRRPVLIEFSVDAGETWNPVPPEWGWRVIPGEIGILFTGSSPPPLLRLHGDQARLRITGTVTGDRRLVGQAELLSDAPLQDVVVELIDVSDRFHDRRPVTAGGDLRSQLEPTAGRDEQHDLDDITSFAESVRDENQHLSLSLSAGLIGIRTDYEIGDRLERIAGREIDLATLAPGAGEARYPVITEIHWDLVRQTTRLHARTA